MIFISRIIEFLTLRSLITSSELDHLLGKIGNELHTHFKYKLSHFNINLGILAFNILDLDTVFFITVFVHSVT